MNSKVIVKGIGITLGVTGSIGASMLTGGIFNPIIGSATTTLSRVVMLIGGAGLGGIASDMVYNWFTAKADETNTMVDTIKETIQKAKETNEVSEEEVEA